MKTMKISLKDQKTVGAVIVEIADLTRKRIRALDPSLQDFAWATVSCGIVSAGLHDCGDPTPIVAMVVAALEAEPVLRAPVS